MQSFIIKQLLGAKSFWWDKHLVVVLRGGFGFLFFRGRDDSFKNGSVGIILSEFGSLGRLYRNVPSLLCTSDKSIAFAIAQGFSVID